MNSRFSENWACVSREYSANYRRTSRRTAAISVSISSNFGSAIPFFLIPSSVAMIWMCGMMHRLFSFFAAHRSPHPSITTSFPPLITASISRVDCFACRCPSKRSGSFCARIPATCVVSFPVLETPEQVMRINGLLSVIFPPYGNFSEPGYNQSFIFFSLL